jgi:hypothetical protein
VNRLEPNWIFPCRQPSRKYGFILIAHLLSLRPQNISQGSRNSRFRRRALFNKAAPLLLFLLNCRLMTPDTKETYRRHCKWETVVKCASNGNCVIKRQNFVSGYGNAILLANPNWLAAVSMSDPHSGIGTVAGVGRPLGTADAPMPVPRFSPPVPMWPHDTHRWSAAGLKASPAPIRPGTFQPILENPDNVKAPEGKRGLHGRLAPSKVYQSGSHNCWCK